MRVRERILKNAKKFELLEPIKFSSFIFQVVVKVQIPPLSQEILIKISSFLHEMKLYK